MALLTAAGAVLAAMVVQLIGIWDWNKFWQDIAKNVFIAGVVTIGAASIKRYQEDRQRRRIDATFVSVKTGWLQLIVTGWSDAGEMTTDNRSLELSAAQQVGYLQEMSARVREVLDSDDPVVTYIRLTSLRWPLAGYMAEGARQRRRRYLTPLLLELSVLETSTDEALAVAAVRARSRTIQALGVMDHTDSAIVERLLVERTTPILTKDIPKTSRLFDGMAEMSAAAIAIDPCYLVLFHLDQNLARIEIEDGGLSKDNSERVRLLLDQMRHVLRAILRETEAVTALIRDLRQMHSVAQEVR